MIGQPVGLLQLDLGEAAAESLQPRVRVAIRAGGAGHALVTDVEAEPPRDVIRVAVGEEVLDLRHRRRFAHGNEILDKQVVEPRVLRVLGDDLEVVFQAAPPLCATCGRSPIGRAHGADVPAGGGGAERRGQVDDTSVPGQCRFTASRVGMHEQVERVRGEAGEGRVRAQPVGVERGARALDRVAATRERVDPLDEVERQLDQVEAEVVAYHGRPIRRPRPALQGETRVDAEVHVHQNPLDWRCGSSVCDIELGSTRRVAEVTTAR